MSEPRELSQGRLASYARAEPVALASRIVAALAALSGAFPVVASAFGWVDWSVDQLEAYSVAEGAILGAMAVILGVQVRDRVTAMFRPRDDAGNPLTPGPIGSDDPEELPPI